MQPKEDKWPKMRLGHHVVCYLGFDTDNPWLLISGGRIKHQLPPKDIWILNLATLTWREVDTTIDFYRVYHASYVPSLAISPILIKGHTR